MRVAIFGGDSRAQRAPWPSGYDLRFYTGAKYGSKSPQRLVESVRSGRLDAVVVLTKFIGHSDHAALKALDVEQHLWPKSVEELARRGLKELFPLPPEVVTVSQERKETDIMDEIASTTTNAAANEAPETPKPMEAPVIQKNGRGFVWTPDEVAAVEALVESGVRSPTDIKHEVEQALPGAAARSVGAFAKQIDKIVARKRREGALGGKPSRQEKILQILSDVGGPLSSTTIAGKLRARGSVRNKVFAALNSMWNAKKIVRTGGVGTKNDPYVYGLPGASSATDAKTMTAVVSGKNRSPKFTREALETALRETGSVRGAAKKLGVYRTTIKFWSGKWGLTFQPNIHAERGKKAKPHAPGSRKVKQKPVTTTTTTPTGAAASAEKYLVTGLSGNEVVARPFLDRGEALKWASEASDSGLGAIEVWSRLPVKRVVKFEIG